MDPSPFSYQETKRSFWKRYGFVVGGAVVVGLLFFIGSKMLSQHQTVARAKPVEMVMVRPLPPPPTPPPPPPPTQTPREETMMEQSALTEADTSPPADSPPEADSAGGTNISGGSGSDGFGLSGPGGLGLGGKSNAARTPGSRFGWYASQVVKTIDDALRRHPKTSFGNFDLQVRIWADETGRITRARLARSTGDVSVDTAIEQEVLLGTRLAEPPPADMPMPIVLRIKARRPS